MFEQLGYFKEYYINNRFFGTIKCEKDRDIIGYSGRIDEILSETIILDNGKRIIKGIKVSTLIYPLNGKIVK